MRSTRRTRRNPGWSHDLLDAIWGDLKRRLGPSHRDLMPVAIDDALPSDGELLQATNPAVHEFGSGLWGVAMPTGNRRWTMKLTHDHSEAQLVNCLRKLGLSCSLEGVAKCSPVYEIKDVSKPTFVYWREQAKVAGYNVWDTFHGTSRETMAIQARHRLHDLLDVIKDDPKPSEAAAAFRQLDNNPLLAATGRDMLTLLKKGILVTDLNMTNWGIVPRRPNKLTLIDPGLVRYMTPRAKALRSNIPWL